MVKAVVDELRIPCLQVWGVVNLCIASDGQNSLAPRRRNKIKTKPLAESLFSFRQGLCQCRYMLLIRRFSCMTVNLAVYFPSIPAPIPAGALDVKKQSP